MASAGPDSAAMTAPADLFPFDNSYVRLPGKFYSRLAPTPVATPRLIALNRALAATLGLDANALTGPRGVAIFAGNHVPANAAPLAMAYAGHQFGSFVPQLGDGRAILLGEVVGRDGLRRDIQLKGSGPTPYSRRGDGRAALGPVLREYIVSEAMAALGVPTTRTLAAVTTGENVFRETELPGAVLTRVASSHIRVGTFQFFAARGDHDGLRHLSAHVIARHYPEAAAATNPARACLDAIIARQAALITKWMMFGFIHGVMNTDNMAIAGETIDYGPCAFMDTYHPRTVFSSIDEMGRYAFANQPAMAQWNLARLAEAFLPLLAENQDDALKEAQAAINLFAAHFEAAHARGLAQKLGFSASGPEEIALAIDLLKRMEESGTDFTLTYRALCDAALGAEHDAEARALFSDPAIIDEWAARWRQRHLHDGTAPQARRAQMRAVNPRFIPRNHRVEEAIAAAMRGDFAPFERLQAVLSLPFDDQPENALYAAPPRPDEAVLRTFCGT